MPETMWDTDYPRVQGKTAKAAVKRLAAFSAQDLATAIVNQRMNDFLSENNEGASFPQNGDGAVIPYHGWYWRSVDFFKPHGVVIARSGDLVGVCMSNKWDYPSRSLTEEELKTFRTLVYDAMNATAGPSLADTNAAKAAGMAKAGEFIRALDVPDNDRDW